VADAARNAVSRLKIDPEKILAAAAAQKIGEMTGDAAITAVENSKGDIARGAQLFTTIGCNACHTVKQDEPLKGPFLGTIANVYRRRQIAEAILVPNKTIAQGFVANHFELKDGSEVDGFVVREAAEAVTIRTIAAKEQTIQIGEIIKRQKQERSLMPEGLAAGMSVQEFASLLDYLESLPKAK
jgi:putative heme-binding domain-containing protein